jgi:hypothetical protein
VRALVEHLPAAHPPEHPLGHACDDVRHVRDRGRRARVKDDSTILASGEDPVERDDVQVHEASERPVEALHEGELEESVGAERVRFVAVDRLVIDALKAADLWKFVPYVEARPDASFRMFHAEVAAALDHAVRDAGAGRVTVLGQPSLLGTLGLMDWLSGFYERARGGKHGLVVLAVPGGIHEDRVRLNEKYNLPYTPDMAAVYLEAETR